MKSYPQCHFGCKHFKIEGLLKFCASYKKIIDTSVTKFAICKRHKQLTDEREVK